MNSLLLPFKAGQTFSLVGYACLPPANSWSLASQINDKKTGKVIQSLTCRLLALDGPAQAALVGGKFEGATHTYEASATATQSAAWPKVQANADSKFTDDSGVVRYSQTYDFQIIKAETP